MDSNLWEALIRIIVCLPIVGLLAYLIIKFGVAKNYSRTRGSLRIIEQVMLLPKATLNIVKVGDEYLLFSATENEIVFIRQMENYHEKELMEFQTYLGDAIKKFRGGSESNG